jgi:glycerol kinase
MQKIAYTSALDQGTTSSRAILFDQGQICGSAAQEFPSISRIRLGRARPDGYLA